MPVNSTGTYSVIETNPFGRFLPLSGGTLTGSLSVTGDVTATGDISLGASGALRWSTTRSRITSAANGNITLQDAAGTDFGLIQLGGTTSAFPALKRSGAALLVRLADDSNFAFLQANSYYLGNGTFLASTTNGNIVLRDAAATTFGLLQFGGTTSSFPELKRSTTVVQARLADDSAFAPLQGQLRTDTNYSAGAIVATGSLRLYDATGTAYLVACVAA